MEIVKPEVTIYTDGGTDGNPSTRGAWGAVLRYQGVTKHLSGRIQGERITNIRAEMAAAIEALKALKRPCKVTLYSDLQLLVNGGNREWGRHSNVDLWALIEQQQQIHEVTFKWVKGHSTDMDNDRCHRLVTEVLQTWRKESA